METSKDIPTRKGKYINTDSGRDQSGSIKLFYAAVMRFKSLYSGLVHKHILLHLSPKKSLTEAYRWTTNNNLLD